MSIRNIFAAAGVTALALTLVLHASATWYRATYTMIILVLIAATLVARRGDSFWFGFAFCGWVCFYVGVAQPGSPAFGINHDWLPASLAYKAWFAILDWTPLGAGQAGLGVQTLYDLQQRRADSSRTVNLLIILPQAVVGGFVSRRLSRQHRDDRMG